MNTTTEEQEEQQQESEAVQEEPTPPPAVIPPADSGPSFHTPLLIRLFLVAATIFLFKMVYDISQQEQANAEAIAALNNRIDALSAPLNQANLGIERLSSGFSDIIKGVGIMGKEVNKSARNVQMIQNDIHEEMGTIRKKVNDISNRLTALQQELRNPYRR